MNCPNCGMSASADDKFCSNCGSRMSVYPQPAKRSHWKMLISLVTFVSLGGVSYLLLAQYNDEQPHVPNSDVLGISASNPEQAEPAKTEQPVKEQDRIALIKEVQEKVFTVLTETSSGSGFLYKSGGYVVTNAHVIAGEMDVQVRNVEGKNFPAKVVGISANYDIALLHVPAYATAEPLEIEQQESQIGLQVTAFGTPKGLENTAAIGYVTGKGRDLVHGSFQYDEIYQMDAQIDQGSSGGPLIDASTGKVIGINSLLYTSETSTNYGFSIPLYRMTTYFDAWVKQPLTHDEILAASVGSVNAVPSNQQEAMAALQLLAGQFVQQFRASYEQALNNGDFGYVAGYLEGNAYDELQDYIHEVSVHGHLFQFFDNSVLNISNDQSYFYVDMNETFGFYSASAEYEYFERFKTYTVYFDGDHFYIVQIDIHE